MVRLRRSDLTRPGLSRRRSGRGFTYLGADGARIPGTGTIERVRSLAIPPAWENVWISPDPRGHIQAGADPAGRKHCLHHPAWRTARHEQKVDRVLKITERLPQIRDRPRADPTGRGPTRDRVLAAVVTLLDLGMFRIGSDAYAARDEDPPVHPPAVAPARPGRLRTPEVSRQIGRRTRRHRRRRRGLCRAPGPRDDAGAASSGSSRTGIRTPAAGGTSTPV